MASALKLTKDELKVQEYESEIIECFNQIEKISKVKTVYLSNDKINKKHKEISSLLTKISYLKSKKDKILANWDPS